MNIPTHLYHYTNIENLALILKNKTIRFNPLDKMDDLQEKEIRDAKDIGKVCYVSSWTDDAEESIPMWNMYASLKSGIRIKMENIPFEDRPDNVDTIRKMIGPSLELKIFNENPKSLVPVDEQMINGIFVFPNKAQDILKKIAYTRDKNKLYPYLISHVNGATRVNLDLVGTYKNEKWEFQREWRYLFFIVAHELSNTPEIQFKDIRKTMDKLLEGKYERTVPFYDIPISNKAFSEMEITLSPRISAGNRIIVENLVEKYNSSAKIIDSSLVGLI